MKVIASSKELPGVVDLLEKIFSLDLTKFRTQLANMVFSTNGKSLTITEVVGNNEVVELDITID
jgi:hypothetical protein